MIQAKSWQDVSVFFCLAVKQGAEIINLGHSCLGPLLGRQLSAPWGAAKILFCQRLENA